MPNQSPTQNRIKRFADERGISCLLHFTLVNNLPIIIKRGILSREEIYEKGITAHAGSEIRLDKNDSVVSLSVSATSHKIFRSKTKDDNESEWVILALDPSILWTHDCRFCFQNAASNWVKKHKGLVNAPWAFEFMFSDKLAPAAFKGESYRDQTDIPYNFSTDPDAEVQVYGRIDPELIIEAWVCQMETATKVQDNLNQLSDCEREVLVADFSSYSNGYSKWITP